MKRLFLDTEFNGFGGKLISMALVPENKTEAEFYREIEMNDQLDPWVRVNVVPMLTEVAVSRKQFQIDLAQYLLKTGECTIIADWPDDIRYFCESVITGPGERINMPQQIKFELDFRIDYVSAIPHNALYDARAIRDVGCKL
jgi:hypothetical protein